jgi:small subunit ribosomal protein S6
MQKYEIIVIIDALISETEIQSKQDSILKILKDGAAEVTHVDPWGKRRLAYKINKKNDGYYILIYFSADPASEALKEIDRFCRLDEKILRHMICNEIPSKFAKAMKELKIKNDEKAAKAESSKTAEAEEPAESEEPAEAEEQAAGETEEQKSEEVKETPAAQTTETAETKTAEKEKTEDKQDA